MTRPARHGSARPAPRSAPRRRRAGFTLLELMVALALGALVVATMYTLSGASARTFQTQQRISQLQLQTRLALERVRRDIAATGFGGTPDSQAERSCGARGIATRLYAVQLTDHDPAATTALGAGGSTAVTHGDRLRLMGNFATSDTYLVANTGSANGASVYLQSNWQAFRRSFAADPLGTSVDTSLFTSVFAPGRLVHVTHPRGYHFFATISSSAVDSAGRTPTVSISPPLPAQDECNYALCVGCQISPLMLVEYGIDTAANVAPQLASADPAVVGTNTVLYRRELDPTTGDPLPNAAPRVLLEYAIHFDAGIRYDAAPVGNPPQITPAPPLPASATIPAGRESRVRSIQISLAARTSDIDPAFPWPYAGNRPTGATESPITSFQVFTDGRPGTAHVRTAMAEFVLENLALRGL
ncbi:MAG: prepilin-type N-terminal cleavage/methylation domain-containing protein [Sandaracinus sp.]